MKTHFQHKFLSVRQHMTPIHMTLGDLLLHMRSLLLLKKMFVGGKHAEGCTVLLKGGTISMPTGRHVDNDVIPGLKTKTYF